MSLKTIKACVVRERQGLDCLYVSLMSLSTLIMTVDLLHSSQEPVVRLRQVKNDVI